MSKDIMSDDTKQQLSALIDGELTPDAGRFLMRRVHRERELLEQWQRWHLIRDCLQKQDVTPLRDDFAERIAAELAGTARPRSAAAVRPALRWAGGLAVAASVALVALLAVPSPSNAPGLSDAPQAAAQVVSSGLSERDLRPNLAPVTHTVSATQGRPLSSGGRGDPLLEAYLLQHNAAQMQSGANGLLPFVPLSKPSRQWTMVPIPAVEAPPAVPVGQDQPR